MALLNFNAANVDPQSAYEPIPAAWYNCAIVESESKENNAGNGSYLTVTLKVLDGQYAGRQIFDLMNLVHPNAVAKEIAEKRLSAYCHATGVIQVQDSQQLHGIPFMAKIGIKVDKTGQYDPSNDVRGVKPAGAATAPTPGFSAATNSPPATFGSTPPAGFGRPAPVAQPAPQVQAPAPVAQPAIQPPPAAPAAGGATPPWAKRKPA